MTTSAIQNLEELYSFRQQAEVLSFLDQHPFLVPALFEIYPRIRHYFPDSPLTLKIFHDMDTVGVAELVIVIGTNFDVKETLRRYEELDDEWWPAETDYTQAKLSVNLEFV